MCPISNIWAEGCKATGDAIHIRIQQQLNREPVYFKCSSCGFNLSEFIMNKRMHVIAANPVMTTPVSMAIKTCVMVRKTVRHLRRKIQSTIMQISITRVP